MFDVPADASRESLIAYLQGAQRDATWSSLHKTVRFGQKDRRWLEVLAGILSRLDIKSWLYREGCSREFWVLETCAPILRAEFEPGTLEGNAALSFVRGYFDADGGMPRSPLVRLYFQFVQKNR